MHAPREPRPSCDSTEPRPSGSGRGLLPRNDLRDFFQNGGRCQRIGFDDVNASRAMRGPPLPEATRWCARKNRDERRTRCRGGVLSGGIVPNVEIGLRDQRCEARE